MTFAEFIILLVVGALVYRALRPLRDRLERIFRRWGNAGRGQPPVIDITDYTKKKKPEKDA